MTSTLPNIAAHGIATAATENGGAHDQDAHKDHDWSGLPGIAGPGRTSGVPSGSPGRADVLQEANGRELQTAQRRPEHQQRHRCEDAQQ